MTKIRDAFKDGKAFIPFLTCGDPDLETTEKLVCAMAEAGADLIELGIPFSDPTAEGPVIQRANVRALSDGVTTDKVFDMVVKIRKNSSIPMVFMTYANVVFSYLQTLPAGILPVPAASEVPTQSFAGSFWSVRSYIHFWHCF